MRVRTPLAVVLAASLAAPAAASAQARQGTSGPGSGPASAAAAAPDSLSLGGLVGYEWGDHVDGFQLRADGELPFEQLSPVVKLSFVGSAGFTHSTYGIAGLDLTVNRLKIVPAARFTVQLSPEVSVYGDAGAGLHYTSVTWNFAPFGRETDSGIGLLLRLGVGGFYRLGPNARILGELAFDPTFGAYHESSVALLAGLMYQL